MARWAPALERFLSNVSKDGPIPAHRPDLGPCEIWLGALDREGYGSIWANGRANLAHRFAYEMRHGPIPEGMKVCHHCDIPACTRDEHHFLGTQRQNVLDAWAKGRGKTPNQGKPNRRELARLMRLSA